MSDAKWLTVYGVIFTWMGAMHWVLLVPAFICFLGAVVSWAASINTAKIILRDKGEG